MAPLFELAGPDLDPGYLNLRTAEYPAEQVVKAALEGMWLRFEPYADADFAMAFAHDPDARFWEMYLGCALLDAGKALQLRANRAQGQGNPDLCIIDGERRIWIEAISPDVGDIGVDQVPGLVMLEDGGAAQAQPIRHTPEDHERFVEKNRRSISTAQTMSSVRTTFVSSPYRDRSSLCRQAD